MLDRFDNELVIAGQIEKGSAGPRVRQLNQPLVTQGVLPTQSSTLEQDERRAASSPLSLLSLLLLNFLLHSSLLSDIILHFC